MAPLEVVPQTEHRLQRPELLVRLVTVAPLQGARKPRRLEARLPTRLVGECLRGLELVPVRAHVHSQIRVAREAFPAHLAEVKVLRQQLHRVELHHVVVAVVVVEVRRVQSRSLREREHVSRGGDEGGAVGDDVANGG